VVEAAAQYFADPDVRARLAALRKPELWSYGVIAANRSSVVVDFGNFYVDPKRILLRRVLREQYGLLGKEAKAVHEALGLAHDQRLENAVKAHVKAAKRTAHRAREGAEAARRAATQAAADLGQLPAGASAADKDAARAAVAAAQKLAEEREASFKAAAKAVADKRKVKESDKDALLGTLVARLPQRKPRRKPASEEEEEEEAEEARLTLQEIAEAELALLPRTLVQYRLMLYRVRLQQRLAAAAPEARRYNLCPLASAGGTVFVHVQHETVHKLLTGQFSLPKGEARVDANSFQALMHRLVTPEARKELLCGRGRTGDFGRSFCTDGTAVHFTVANAAMLQQLARKDAAADKGKARAQRGAVAEEAEEAEENLDFSGSIDATIEAHRHKSFPLLPRGAKVTALDPGNAYVYASATDGYQQAANPAAGEPFAGRKGRGPPGAALLSVLSTRSFNQQTGQYQRRRTLERALAKERLDNPAFAAAEKVFRETDTSATDPATLLAALQARGKAAPELQRFYQTPQRDKARFDAFNAERSVMERHAKLLVPTKLHYVVVGDGQFPSTIGRGRESGKSAKFVRTLLEMFPDRVFLIEEFRSSKLCSTTSKYVRGAARARPLCSCAAAALQSPARLHPPACPPRVLRLPPRTHA
jgi:hypothetical protein